MIIFSARLQRSRVGRAWAAIREDEDAAELMGVPTFKFKLLAFAIGAMIGGLAGGMYASKAIFIPPPTSRSSSRPRSSPRWSSADRAISLA